MALAYSCCCCYRARPAQTRLLIHVIQIGLCDDDCGQPRCSWFARTLAAFSNWTSQTQTAVWTRVFWGHGLESDTRRCCVLCMTLWGHWQITAECKPNGIVALYGRAYLMNDRITDFHVLSICAIFAIINVFFNFANNFEWPCTVMIRRRGRLRWLAFLLVVYVHCTHAFLFMSTYYLYNQKILLTQYCMEK